MLSASISEMAILMRVQVLFFAAARDAAGVDSLMLDINASATIQDLKVALMNQAPRLSSISGSLLWAVNNQYQSLQHVLQDNDTVACFPPVSGG